MHQWAMPDQPARHDFSINQKHEAEYTAAYLGPIRPRDSLPLQKDLHTILRGRTLFTSPLFHSFCPLQAKCEIPVIHWGPDSGLQLEH